MNPGQPSPQQEVIRAAGKPQYKNAVPVLPVGLTVVVCVVALVFVRPHVGPWLEVRRAYRNLSSPDYDTRKDAIRLLRSRGEETEDALIALLHHPDAGVRSFASGELAQRAPVTDDIIEAFLIALQSNQNVAEISRQAPSLFVRHAKDAIGPLTETDRRMMAWLRSELNSTNPERSGAAAWALTAFVKRDPSLREPVAAYLKHGTFFYKYLVLRELADSDPSLRDEYVDVLLSGIRSLVHADQANALYGLTNLKPEPDDLRSRLKARRDESTNPGEISRIDQALEGLRTSDSAMTAR